MIPFTRRELVKAWACARYASKVAPRTDAHRLLLFYAIECGLKAILLRRLNLDLIDEQIGKQYLHDLNDLVTALRIGQDYTLPFNLLLQPIRRRDGSEERRSASIGSLNQIWRYGGNLSENDNSLLEKQLEKIEVWIAKEIR